MRTSEALLHSAVQEKRNSLEGVPPQRTAGISRSGLSSGLNSGLNSSTATRSNSGAPGGGEGGSIRTSQGEGMTFAFEDMPGAGVGGGEVTAPPTRSTSLEGEHDGGDDTDTSRHDSTDDWNDNSERSSAEAAPANTQASNDKTTTTTTVGVDNPLFVDPPYADVVGVMTKVIVTEMDMYCKVLEVFGAGRSKLPSKKTSFDESTMTPLTAQAAPTFSSTVVAAASGSTTSSSSALLVRSSQAEAEGARGGGYGGSEANAHSRDSIMSLPSSSTVTPSFSAQDCAAAGISTRVQLAEAEGEDKKRPAVEVSAGRGMHADVDHTDAVAASTSVSGASAAPTDMPAPRLSSPLAGVGWEEWEASAGPTVADSFDCARFRRRLVTNVMQWNEQLINLCRAYGISTTGAIMPRSVMGMGGTASKREERDKPTSFFSFTGGGASPAPKAGPRSGGRNEGSSLPSTPMHRAIIINNNDNNNQNNNQNSNSKSGSNVSGPVHAPEQRERVQTGSQLQTSSAIPATTSTTAYRSGAAEVGDFVEEDTQEGAGGDTEGSTSGEEEGSGDDATTEDERRIAEKVSIQHNRLFKVKRELPLPPRQGHHSSLSSTSSAAPSSSSSTSNGLVNGRIAAAAGNIGNSITVNLAELHLLYPRLSPSAVQVLYGSTGFGHLYLPALAGDVLVPIYEDEPSSLIAYTLSTRQHRELVDPDIVELAKEAEELDRACGLDQFRRELISGGNTWGDASDATDLRRHGSMGNVEDTTIRLTAHRISNYVGGVPVGTAHRAVPVQEELDDDDEPVPTAPAAVVGAADMAKADSALSSSSAPTSPNAPPGGPHPVAGGGDGGGKGGASATTTAPVASGTEAEAVAAEVGDGKDGSRGEGKEEQPTKAVGEAPMASTSSSSSSSSLPSSSSSSLLSSSSSSRAQPGPAAVPAPPLASMEFPSWFYRRGKMYMRSSLSGDRDLMESALRQDDHEHLKLCFSDFKNPIQPNSDLTTFSVTVYYPKQFHALRAHYCDGETRFIESMSRCSRWQASGGKSGSTFSQTKDGAFVLKYVSQSEMRMFLEMAPNYFAYISKACFHNLPSVLCRIVGVFQLSWKKVNKTRMSSKYVIVMPNLFADGTYSKIFDLKGSTRNRFIDEKEAPANQVLLDSNFSNFMRGMPIALDEVSKALLKMSVFNDTLFLSSMEVVDYSILVGIKKHTNEIVVGIIDFVRQYTWDKRLETGVKSVGMIAGKDLPTVISPESYKIRFRSAMDRYFMAIPEPTLDRNEPYVHPFKLTKKKKKEHSEGEKD